jgi:hypothetical protein
VIQVREALEAMKSVSRTADWDDLPGRRLQPDRVDRAVAERVAKIFARAEQHALNQAQRVDDGIISSEGECRQPR